MKRLLVMSIVSVLMLSGAVCVQAAEMKIAYIDVQRLIMESAPGKGATGKMEKFHKDKLAQIEKMEQKIKQLSDQLSSKAPLTEKAKADLDDQLQNEMRKRERFVKDAQEELRKKEATLIKPIQEDLDKIIDNYGKANGYDLIINGKMPGIIFASDRIDITGQILDIYNKQTQEKASQAKPADADKGKKK